jgi:hypothetical protein
MSGQCELTIRFESRLHWKTDTNLFHRVVECGQIVEFTMQVCSQAERQHYDASVESHGASEQLSFGIGLFCVVS